MIGECHNALLFPNGNGNSFDHDLVDFCLFDRLCFVLDEKKETKMTNKFALREHLTNGVATVVFEKLDGTERTMKCTLLAEYLPATVGGESQNGNMESELLTVWDMEKNAWRSFHVDKIKRVIYG